MNRQIRRLSIIVVLMFIALMVSATYIQVIAEPSLSADSRNVRSIYNSFNKQRGPIIVDGAEIAASDPADDTFKWQRKYNDSNLYSHITGYLSVVSDASTGLEKAYNEVLNGRSHSQTLAQINSIITGEKPKGGAIELTLNPAMQRAAADGLGKLRGSVVALDPKTGAVLAMYSTPNYDANSIASHDRKTSLSAFDTLNKDKHQPLVPKATADNFPPGSTFKIITAAAMLSNGITPETILDAPQFLALPDSDKKLPNYANRPCGSGRVPLRYAFGMSCNTPFAKSAMELGADQIRKFAKDFGFNETTDLSRLNVAKSNFPNKLYLPQLAYSAIGQYEVRATPLQMAVVAATIANDGVRMKPYVVGAELDSNLKPVSQTTPEIAANVLTPQVAKDLKGMMEYVVTSRFTTNVHLKDVKIAAKTGTAQTGIDGQDPHAWLVGYAPADNPQIAFAVLIEGVDQGHHDENANRAARIAESLITAGLSSRKAG
ncbi:penicillin-binding protein 2 [Actinomyces sp. zg-332]|uniref:peptidoglycan D,D-transpeptidase FtsI family protein n=1 Tax=Actinomyces sp. zg-332 TaxID=2708340 RepID=UPI001420B29A|nr:penicillin-binding protein 2 [Actinomyces sp. zg-332]QPK94176.1 penicillin-binding protein 2 [Actinomyces sp. zg-332]